MPLAARRARADSCMNTAGDSSERSDRGGPANGGETPELAPLIPGPTPHSLAQVPDQQHGEHLPLVVGRHYNRPESKRNLAAIWLLGLLNNASFVIMLAGAKEMVSGGVGLVYTTTIVPTLLVKLTGPYWFHLCSYDTRAKAAGALMSLSFTLVAYGHSLGSMGVMLLGVGLCSVQQGLGEPTFLALCSQYSPRFALTMWSSGTGFAGPFGYAYVVLLHDQQIGCGLSFSTTLVAANALVAMWCVVWCYMLLPPEAHSPEETQELDDDNKSSAASMTTKERLAYICTLWPYMVPLFLVYFSEYAMQAGAWSAIGFPITSNDARSEFYSYGNWCYQVGVFLSRSSGVIFQADRFILWLMPTLQACFLGFFITVATIHWWYNYGLLVPCFITGLLGGAVYVNAYTLMSKEIAPSLLEFALSAASLADTMGILLADISSVYIQSCLYKYNGIRGATAGCPLF